MIVGDIYIYIYIIPWIISKSPWKITIWCEHMDVFWKNPVGSARQLPYPQNLFSGKWGGPGAPMYILAIWYCLYIYIYLCVCRIRIVYVCLYVFFIHVFIHFLDLCLTCSISILFQIQNFSDFQYCHKFFAVKFNEITTYICFVSF